MHSSWLKQAQTKVKLGIDRAITNGPTTNAINPCLVIQIGRTGEIIKGRKTRRVACDGGKKWLTKDALLLDMLPLIETQTRLKSIIVKPTPFPASSKAEVESYNTLQSLLSCKQRVSDLHKTMQRKGSGWIVARELKEMRAHNCKGKGKICTILEEHSGEKDQGKQDEHVDSIENGFLFFLFDFMELKHYEWIPIGWSNREIGGK